jgi:hypothetical protein
MQNKETKIIIQVMGLLGVIFCLIAFLTPWASTYGVSIFTFGYFTNYDSSPFFIKFFETGVGEVIFAGIAMIIIFVLTLINFLMGIISVKQIENNPDNRFLILGIIEIITIILYVIAISIAAKSIAPSDAYGIGFIMAIISAIMFFISYFIPKAITSVSSPGSYQQPTYQQQFQYTSQPQSPSSVGVKFCPNCGTQLLKNMIFCSKCGKKF